MKLNLGDMPSYGRCYEIFCNQACVGRMEIEVERTFSFSYHDVKPMDEEDPGYTVEVNHTASAHEAVLVQGHHEPLSAISVHVTKAGKENQYHKDERAQANETILAVMVQAMWDNRHISRDSELEGLEDWGTLEFRLTGTPWWYFIRRDCEAFAKVKAGKLAA